LKAERTALARSVVAAAVLVLAGALAGPPVTWAQSGARTLPGGTFLIAGRGLGDPGRDDPAPSPLHTGYQKQRPQKGRNERAAIRFISYQC